MIAASERSQANSLAVEPLKVPTAYDVAIIFNAEPKLADLRRTAAAAPRLVIVVCV